MLKKIEGRLIYDCGSCGENVFDVSSSENLADPPRTIVCNGCGSRFTAQLNQKGKLVVYRGGVRKPKKRRSKDEQPGQNEEGAGNEEPGGNEQSRVSPTEV